MDYNNCASVKGYACCIYVLSLIHIFSLSHSFNMMDWCLFEHLVLHCFFAKLLVLISCIYTFPALISYITFLAVTRLCQVQVFIVYTTCAYISILNMIRPGSVSTNFSTMYTMDTELYLSLIHISQSQQSGKPLLVAFPGAIDYIH